MAISVTQPLTDVSNLQKQKDELKALEEKKAKDKAEQARAEEKSRMNAESKRPAMTDESQGKKFDKNA